MIHGLSRILSVGTASVILMLAIGAQAAERAPSPRELQMSLIPSQARACQLSPSYKCIKGVGCFHVCK